VTRRKRPDDFDDDDGVRVTDSRGRRIRGNTAWGRAVLREARRMRAAGEPVGQVAPVPVADVLDLERVNRLAADRRARPGRRRAGD
jgi:hypothetical protein